VDTQSNATSTAPCGQLRLCPVDPKMDSWFSPKRPLRPQRRRELLTVLFALSHSADPDLVRRIMSYLTPRQPADILTPGDFVVVRNISGSGLDGVKEARYKLPGRFAEIYGENEGLKAREKRRFALKISTKQVANVGALRAKYKALRKERNILRAYSWTDGPVALRHPNIVLYHGCFEDPSSATLVLESASADLFADVKASPKNLKIEVVRGYSVQMLSGVEYLHVHRIAHRDIKPENVLVVRDKDGTVTLKLADFGESRYFSEAHGDDCEDKDVVGTELFMAPEIFDTELYGKPRQGLKECLGVDVFAVGVVIYELLVRRLPWPHAPCLRTGKPVLEEHRNKLNRGPIFKESRWKAVPDKAKHCVQKLLSPAPDVRPSAQEALQQPWFSSDPEDEPERELSNPFSACSDDTSVGPSTAFASGGTLGAAFASGDPLASGGTPPPDGVSGGIRRYPGAAMESPALRARASPPVPPFLTSPATPPPCCTGWRESLPGQMQWGDTSSHRSLENLESPALMHGSPPMFWCGDGSSLASAENTPRAVSMPPQSPRPALSLPRSAARVGGPGLQPSNVLLTGSGQGWTSGILNSSLASAENAPSAVSIPPQSPHPALSLPRSAARVGGPGLLQTSNVLSTGSGQGSAAEACWT